MMKNLLFVVALVSGFTIHAQTFKAPRNKKEKKDDFTIEVKQSEKNLIDWGIIKEHFSNTKEQDSIQLSVKIKPENGGKFNTRKKYTVRGVKTNLDEMVAKLKKLVDN